MSLATDADAPPKSRRAYLTAAGWALAAATCTGGTWSLVLIGAKWLYNASFVSDELPDGAVGMALPTRRRGRRSSGSFASRSRSDYDRPARWFAYCRC